MRKSKRAKTNDPLDGDLSDFISEGSWDVIQFELREPKDRVLSLRLSGRLLEQIKKKAAALSLDTQKFVRIVLERAIK